MLRIIAAVVSCVLLAGLCLAVETQALTSYFDIGKEEEARRDERAKHLTKEELACAEDGDFVLMIAGERDRGLRVTESLEVHHTWTRTFTTAFGWSSTQAQHAEQHESQLILWVFQQPHTPAAALVARAEVDCLRRAQHATDSVPTTAAPLR